MKLRFKIHRKIWVKHTYQWTVEGNFPDWAGDYMWGNFDTWREAMDAALYWLKGGR